MNVGIDGRSLVGGRAGRGVAHSTSRLAGSLAKCFPDDAWRLLAVGHAPEHAPPGVEVVRRRRPDRLAHGAAALTGRPRLDRLLGQPRPDVFWAPAPAPMAVSPEVPLVLTVHDLAWVQRPADFTSYERAWHRLARVGRLVRRAARVIAVSEATREAAIAWWGLDPARVRVVAPGVTRPAVPSDPRGPRRRLGLPERYLLWVGALEPRKAPALMARAFARARAAGLDADLVVVGEGRAAAALRGPGVHPRGTVSREELEALYAGALALVMPSHAEGLGLPPLEAAACGTPSVLTDLPAFHESLGDAAVFVAPGDDSALAGALLEVCGDAARRERLAAAAAAAVADRTWESAARAIHRVLKEAAAAP